MISLIRDPFEGYAYWWGTSFAAPLVSGQAALLLESVENPFDVTERITNNVNDVNGDDQSNVVETGIINVPNSLPSDQ